MIPFYDTNQKDLFGFRCNRLNYPLHLQASIEFLYVSSGHITLTIGEESRTMQEGEMAVIFPNCTHSYDTPTASADPDMIVDDILLIGLQTPLAGEYTDSLRKFYPERPFLPAELVPPEIPQCMRRLLQQEATKDPDLRICRAYLQLMLALIWPHLQLKPREENFFDDLLYQASEYIVHHYRRPFSLDEMADELGVGKYRLSRIFSDQLHMNFNDLLNNVRVSVAQNLLSSTDMPITEIIYECGFESQATFNRAFRKVCGVSPREYRRNHLLHP